MNFHGFGRFKSTCSLQYRLLLQSFYITYSVFLRTLMTFFIYITMHFTIAIFFTVKVVLVFHRASFPYFHVSRFPPLSLASYGVTFSCPAFSCLAFSASPTPFSSRTSLSCRLKYRMNETFKRTSTTFMTRCTLYSTTSIRNERLLLLLLILSLIHI